MASFQTCKITWHFLNASEMYAFIHIKSFFGIEGKTKEMKTKYKNHTTKTKTILQ